MNAVRSKRFRPGTTGWSAADLDDPRIEERWENGHYEIINGVLTRMPAAYFIGGEALANLIFELRLQLRAKKVGGSFAVEVDVIIDEHRLIKVDACFMTPADKRRQLAEAKKRGKPDPDRARVYVAPTIVIESVSPGHHAHDRVTKFAWYAELGVPHYWILDAHKRTLDAFLLDGGKYRQVAKLARNAVFHPASFEDIEIHLANVWPAKSY